MFVVNVTRASLRLLSQFAKTPGENKKTDSTSLMLQRTSSVDSEVISRPVCELRVAFFLLETFSVLPCRNVCSHEGICRETYVDVAQNSSSIFSSLSGMSEIRLQK